jgi:hypothetical protein
VKEERMKRREARWDVDLKILNVSLINL